MRVIKTVEELKLESLRKVGGGGGGDESNFQTPTQIKLGFIRECMDHRFPPF